MPSRCREEEVGVIMLSGPGDNENRTRRDFTAEYTTPAKRAALALAGFALFNVS
jgi:hypothetical protein